MSDTRPQIADILPDDSVVLFPVDKIWIGEAEARQRKAAAPSDGLIDSIASRGLINPIFIHASGELIAGERRWLAHKKLGKTHIRATVKENISPIIAYQIEALENLQREQLTWQEEVGLVARYHEMKLTVHGVAWTQMGTGTDLGYSVATISRYLIVAAELENPEVIGCQTITAAFNFIQARAERARIAAQSRGLEFGQAAAAALQLPPVIPADATREERTALLMGSLNLQDTAADTVSEIDQQIALINSGKLAAAALEQQQAREAVSDLVINADFLEWAETYDGPKFDVLHCDFPYGKGYRGSNTRRTGRAHINPVYLDDPDIYFELVEGFLLLQDRLAFPVAHCLFWFDMQYYQWTIDQFTAAGWKLVQPFPFIWSKGYQGVAADTKRRPRHVYETCLLFSRGDRKIVKIDKDVIDAQVDEKLHLNQKAHVALKHLLSMFVDEHTAVLDPTCGSGSALFAALQLKAARVLGVELDPSNAEVARFLLARQPKETPGEA